MGAIAYKGKIYGGGGSVENLTDVNVTDVADGDILEYDAETEKWKNSNALSGKADSADLANLGLSVVNGKLCQTYNV